MTHEARAAFCGEPLEGGLGRWPVEAQREEGTLAIQVRLQVGGIHVVIHLRVLHDLIPRQLDHAIDIQDAGNIGIATCRQAAGDRDTAQGPSDKHRPARVRGLDDRRTDAPDSWTAQRHAIGRRDGVFLCTGERGARSCHQQWRAARFSVRQSMRDDMDPDSLRSLQAPSLDPCADVRVKRQLQLPRAHTRAGGALAPHLAPGHLGRATITAVSRTAHAASRLVKVDSRPSHLSHEENPHARLALDRRAGAGDGRERSSTTTMGTAC